MPPSQDAEGLHCHAGSWVGWALLVPPPSEPTRYNCSYRDYYASLVRFGCFCHETITQALRKSWQPVRDPDRYCATSSLPLFPPDACNWSSPLISPDFFSVKQYSDALPVRWRNQCVWGGTLRARWWPRVKVSLKIGRLAKGRLASTSDLCNQLPDFLTQGSDCSRCSWE